MSSIHERAEKAIEDSKKQLELLHKKHEELVLAYDRLKQENAAKPKTQTVMKTTK